MKISVVAALVPLLLLGTLAVANDYVPDDTIIVAEPFGDGVEVGSWTNGWHTWVADGITQIQIKLEGTTWEKLNGYSIEPILPNTPTPQVVQPHFWFRNTNNGVNTELPTWHVTQYSDTIAAISGPAIVPMAGNHADMWFGLWFDTSPAVPFIMHMQMYKATGGPVYNQNFFYTGNTGTNQHHFVSSDVTWQQATPIPEPLTALGVIGSVVGIGGYIRSRRNAA